MSLVGRVYLLVLLAAAPAFGLQLYKDIEQRRAGEAQVHEEARRLVRFAAGELDKVLEGARVFLLAVANHPAVRSGDVDGCNAYLDSMGPPPPPFRGAFLVDLDGRIVCSTFDLQAPVIVSDRSYYRRARETKRFALGDATVSRIDGKLSLPVALPILRPDGAVAAIVAMGLDAESLETTFRDKAWPQDGSISIVDRTGTILVRWPNPELVGKPLSESFRWMLAAPTESTTTGTGPDGIERIGAFVPPAVNQGLLVSVALSKTAALEGLDRALRRDFLVLAGLAALAFLAAAWGGRYFIRAPVEQLSAAAARLQAGDLSARALLPHSTNELGRLGTTFDEMAGAIEARERDLRRSEELFRQFAENVPEVVWVESVDGRLDYVGPAFERIWGLPLGEVRSGRAAWLDAVVPEDRPALEAAIEGARAGRHASAEYRIVRPDGGERWLQSTAFPILDPDGAVIRVARITRDVTERRAVEAEREEALQQRDLLFRELNHGIRNNLQIVRAFLVLQSGRLEDEDAKEALSAASQRIGAVGDLHALLYRGGSIGTLDLGEYLRELCGSLGDAMVDDPERVSIETRCTPLRVDMDRAVLLGLIASELITNSLKYAFPPPAKGRLQVNLEMVDATSARLTVADNGPGFTDSRGEGFGLQIVRMLARQLDATLTFEHDAGAVTRLVFAVPTVPQKAAA